MVGCLGYLVAYNNMDMGTSARLEHSDEMARARPARRHSIDRLLQTVGQSPPRTRGAQPAVSRHTDGLAARPG